MRQHSFNIATKSKTTISDPGKTASAVISRLTVSFRDLELIEKRNAPLIRFLYPILNQISDDHWLKLPDEAYHVTRTHTFRSCHAN